MQAHIDAERNERRAPFLDGFEHLAARAFANDPVALQRRLRYQKVLHEHPIGKDAGEDGLADP